MPVKLPVKYYIIYVYRKIILIAIIGILKNIHVIFYSQANAKFSLSDLVKMVP